MEKKDGHTKITLYIDKVMATPIGKLQLEKCTKNLNKIYSSMDCPKAIHKMWESFINSKPQVVVKEAMENDFVKNYLSKTIDKHF